MLLLPPLLLIARAFSLVSDGRPHPFCPTSHVPWRRVPNNSTAMASMAVVLIIVIAAVVVVVVVVVVTVQVVLIEVVVVVVLAVVVVVVVVVGDSAAEFLCSRPAEHTQILSVYLLHLTLKQPQCT